MHGNFRLGRKKKKQFDLLSQISGDVRLQSFLSLSFQLKQEERAVLQCSSHRGCPTGTGMAAWCEHPRALQFLMIDPGSISSSILGNSGISSWHCCLFPWCVPSPVEAAEQVLSADRQKWVQGLDCVITEKNIAIPIRAWSFPILSTWRDAAAGTAGE